MIEIVKRIANDFSFRSLNIVKSFQTTPKNNNYFNTAYKEG